jgi:glycosyl transferase family 2
MPANQPSLSITVSTITGWPAIGRWLSMMETAAARVGGEIVVVDGSGAPMPPSGAVASTTSWHRHPGLSIFQLRQIGFQQARGPIILVTEDHVIVPPDWCERYLAAFAATPEAMAIGGSVENGATRTLADWAAFLVSQTAVVAPIESGPVSRLSGAVNVAYRADALVDVDDHDGLGANDWLHQRDLHERGGLLIADDTIRVAHDQSCSLAEFTALHFHAGRTTGGFLRAELSPQGRLRLLAIGVAPYVRLARVVGTLNERGHGRTVRRAWPIMLWLLYAQAAGQFIGTLVGPGDSPRRLL